MSLLGRNGNLSLSFFRLFMQFFKSEIYPTIKLCSFQMKYFLLIILLILGTTGCIEGEGGHILSPDHYAEKLQERDPQSIILDVRTPNETSKSVVLSGAINMDWESGIFDTEVSRLNRKTTVFVYCNNGIKSSEAAGAMRLMGFEKVYELQGGLDAWHKKGLSADAGVAKRGLDKNTYLKLVNNHPKVLVDFKAEWCGPCKQMEPFLRELETELKDKVHIMRIDVDENPALANEMKIRGIPSIYFYNHGELVWKKDGFISKAELLRKMEL